METYTNAEIIAVDQDQLGAQGRVLWENCPLSTLDSLRGDPEFIPDCQQVWSKPLNDGTYAVTFVNYALSAATTVCDTSCMAELGMQSASIRDLWAHEDLGEFTTFSVHNVADGGSQTYKFTKVS